MWALAPLERVQQNVATTGYPADLIAYRKGKVEDTLPAQAPERIALLRLDTDWYESTRQELIHLPLGQVLPGPAGRIPATHWRSNFPVYGVSGNFATVRQFNDLAHG